MIEKRKALRIPKITRAAQGENCTVNAPCCNYNPETVVFAHLNEQFAGKGRGQKADDCAGVFACSNCHDWLDGRLDGRLHTPQYTAKDDKDWYWLRAYYRTIRRLFDLGVIK